MQTWVKATIVGGSLVVAGFAALAGTSAYLVLRHFDTRTASEADALLEFQAIRSRFGGRPPLIEAVDPQTRPIQFNRSARPDGRPISTFRVLVWNAGDKEILRTEGPLWLLRISMADVLAQVGIGPERFRLTVPDIERYGPGVVVDYSRPGHHVILWVD